MRTQAPSVVALEHEPAPISSSGSSSADDPWRWQDCVLDRLVADLTRITTSASTADAAISFDVLLRRIGRALCNVFGLSRCSVYLATDASTFRGIVGFSAGHRLDVAVRAKRVDVATDQVTAEVVRTRAPVVVADARTDVRPPAAVVRRLGIADLVAVPLVVEDTVIGAVYLDDDGRAHRYEPTDVARAATLARRAASLVRQAQVVLALRRALRQARVERETLERTRRGQLGVDAAAMVGGCRSQLVAYVGETLDRPVLLLGTGFELVHVAGADESFQHAVRTAWRAAVFARHASSAVASASASAVLTPLPSIGLGCRALISPIRGHAGSAGALVALEVGRPFDDVDRQVLDHAAVVLDLRTGASLAAPRPAGEGSFGALAATAIGQRVGFPAVVAWVDLGAGAAHRLVERLAMNPAQHVLLPREGGVGVVVPVGDTAHVAGALVELMATAPGGRGVVSRVITAKEDLAVACAEVDNLATMLERNAVVGRVVSIDDLGAARLVLAGATAEAIARIVDETLLPLAPAAVGPALSAVLLDTVRTLIATDGSIREVARRLEVHENTVRYRLRRIRELTALDTSVVGDLFQLQVALCAREHLGFELPSAEACAAGAVTIGTAAR